jgi:hypothetical protein
MALLFIVKVCSCTDIDVTYGREEIICTLDTGAELRVVAKMLCYVLVLAGPPKYEITTNT